MFFGETRLARDCFFHDKRGLACSVHGDDFTTAGPKCELDVFEDQLEAKYELKKGGRLGPGASDCKELTVLNRVIRWTDEGIEYEADPRQAEKLLEGLSLDDFLPPLTTTDQQQQQQQPAIKKVKREKKIITSNPNVKIIKIENHQVDCVFSLAILTTLIT